MFTSGQIAARFAPLARRRESVPPRHRVARAARDLLRGRPGRRPAGGELTKETAETVAQAARRRTGASHALAVLIDLDDGPDKIDFGGTICLAVATADGVESRRSRILGGRDWVRLGATEMGLDSLRRYLQALPVAERIDFEKT
jgi:nicotinamide-nucleotide amidase